VTPGIEREARSFCPTGSPQPLNRQWSDSQAQPKNPRPGLVPGACKGNAHRRDHLGYAGRRVLVSRKWSGKTLADHRGDRKPGLPRCLVFRQLTLPPIDGRQCSRAMRTTCHLAGGSCTLWLTASTGRTLLQKLGVERVMLWLRGFGNREGRMGKPREPAAAPVNGIAGCSVTDRESPYMTPLTGTWRARPGPRCRR
jgi:hypothetical protein